MISVVIPLYNKAQSISNTIDSILNQTYQDFEIIIIEGWSTDGSLEVITKLAQQDCRIKVLMQQNRNGVTPARNESILAANSEYIAFIDADDYWDPAYLETLKRLIDTYPDAGIWGFSYGTIINNIKYQPERYTLPQGFKGIIENPWQYGCPYWTGATAVKKSAVLKVGGFDNNIIFGEDIDLWYRLMLEFPCVYEDNVLSYYRQDAENMATKSQFPLKQHIPYHICKYKSYRENNVDFRRYFDREMLYRLYPYALENKSNPDLKRVLSQIDFKLQKKSMKLRFIFPSIYNVYQWIKTKI